MGKRLDILLAIGSRLGEIAIANSYNTNIGGQSFYWHDLDFEYGALGAVTYRDAEEDNVEVNIRRDNQLHLEIEAIAFADDTLATGENLLSDLISAVGKDPTWGGLSTKTTIVRNEKAVETNGKTAVRVILYLDIFYRTNLWEK
ncbi:MAG: hypothetical protein ACRC11_11010 [Xenococcaceae cyanobacterium]